MLRVEAVESLLGHPGKDGDGEEHQEHWTGPHEPKPAPRRGADPLQGGTSLTRGGPKVCLRRGEEERDAEPDGQDAADQERQVQGEGGEGDAEDDAEEGPRVVRLLPTQVHTPQVLFRGLVCDPGLQSPADERVAHPHTAWAASTAAKVGTAPSSANPDPISRKPVMTDLLRP